MNDASFTPISFPRPAIVTIRGQVVSIENYEPSTNEAGFYVPEHVQISLVQDFVPQPELAGAELAEQKYPITLWQSELIQSFRTHGFHLGAVIDLEGYLVLTKREDGAVVPKI